MALLGFVLPAATLATEVEPFESPLTVIGSYASGSGARLSLSPGYPEAFGDAPRLMINDFPLGIAEQVDLELHRVNAFAANASILVAGIGGDQPLAAPVIHSFGGTIVGSPESRVSLGFARVDSRVIVNGWIQTGAANARVFVISSGPFTADRDIAVYDAGAVPAEWLALLPLVCGDVELPPSPVKMPGGFPTPRGAPPCRTASIAIDTDEEFLQLFGGNQVAAAAYVGTLTSAVSEIYKRDFNTRLEIGYLRLWSDGDPWDQFDAYQQLFQVQNYWNELMQSVSRHAVHFLTARTLEQANGLAYLNGLCTFGYDYGMSSQINGYFPYPIENQNPQNWDLYIMAHELGHNFGAPHTHAMVPPVDSCHVGDCSVAPDGTLMSFCNQCPGGLSNVLMQIHPRSVSEGVLPYLSSGAACNLEAQSQITQQPAGINGCPGNAVSLSVAANCSGTPTYQWRKNGEPIAGANSPTLVFESFWPPLVGTYDVVITDDCGELISDGAELGLCSGVVGDLNMNCIVDIGDLSAFLTRFGRPNAFQADFDGDGDVDVSDLAVILGTFGLNGCN